jgi:hypothetical protein
MADRGTVPTSPASWQWAKDVAGPIIGKDYGGEVTSFYGAQIATGGLKEVRMWNYVTHTWDLVPGA